MKDVLKLALLVVLLAASLCVVGAAYADEDTTYSATLDIFNEQGTRITVPLAFGMTRDECVYALGLGVMTPLSRPDVIGAENAGIDINAEAPWARMEYHVDVDGALVLERITFQCIPEDGE